ncbi:MAG: XRE family transcriptional regulator [Mesorhizobium sp.]|nr:MAG: XRE family transcriptional regulator [Mesorhizobium sp.]
MFRKTANRVVGRISVRFHPGVVRKLRAEREVTQHHLALGTDLGEATVGRAEAGESVSLETAKAICGFFDVDVKSVADIVGREASVFYKAGSPSDYLFDDMLREIAKSIGEDHARSVMDRLFDNLRGFPFGVLDDEKLRKIKTYDLNAFIIILEMRASAIMSRLRSIIDGHVKLNDPSSPSGNMTEDQASIQAVEWRNKFSLMHQAHVTAIREGHFLAAHEIRSEISDLLEIIRSSISLEKRDNSDMLRFIPGIYSSH